MTRVTYPENGLNPIVVSEGEGDLGPKFGPICEHQITHLVHRLIVSGAGPTPAVVV